MRKAIREMKNVVYQFNEIELKVREATNNDRYMVNNSTLAVIARATNDYQDYPSLFAMLWKRLTDLEHVMHVQKALYVVEYLLRYGAERFINDAKRRARDIAALQKYKHYDEQNQDDAKEARARAKAVYALLMDDQLLAQERAKCARLQAEGRLNGRDAASHWDNYNREHDDQQQNGEEDLHPQPVRRAAPQAAAAARSRRNEEEDPFENAPVAGRKAAPAAAAAPKKAVQKEVDDVDEPADEDDEEAAAAAAKKAKKEKKKKKKEEEARRAAEEAAAQQAQAGKHQHHHHAAASSSGGDIDLMSMYDSQSNGASGGDLDILTGMRNGGAHASNASGGAPGDLSDLFANQSLDEPPPFFQSSNGDMFASGHGNGNGLDTSFGSSNPGEHEGEGQVVSPTNALVNLNDLNAPRHTKKASVDTGVSMSMMRSIQPLGTPVKAENGDKKEKKRSNVPSSIPLAQQQYQLTGFMGYPQQGPPLGPPLGAPYGQMGHPGMGMYGAQPQAPMMAIMPPGMNGGGYPGMPPPQQAYGAVPHMGYGMAPPPASSPMTFTQMRQAPAQKSNAIPVFEVVAEQPRAVEPVNYMQGQPSNSRFSGQEYKSFYGTANGANPPRF